MPKREKRQRKEANDGDSSSPKKLRQDSPEMNNSQLELHMLKWSDVNYDIVWDIFGHLSTIQKLKYRRVSSTWNDIQLKHISTSPTVKLDFLDFSHWETVFYPPIRETRRTTHKRKVELSTDKTRLVILDFEDNEIDQFYPWISLFGLKPGSWPLLHCLSERRPQIRHILLSKMKVIQGPVTTLSYETLRVLGCSPKLRLTVMVYQSIMAELPPLRYIGQPHLQDELKLLQSFWPNSIKLDGEGNDYWRPLRDLCMAYWPFPADQLQWLEECIMKIPTNDRLFDFLDHMSCPQYKREDFPENIVLPLHKYYRQRSVLAVCACYMNVHRSRWNLPSPPHALTWSSAFPKK